MRVLQLSLLTLILCSVFVACGSSGPTPLEKYCFMLIDECGLSEDLEEIYSDMTPEELTEQVLLCAHGKGSVRPKTRSESCLQCAEAAYDAMNCHQFENCESTYCQDNIYMGE